MRSLMRGDSSSARFSRMAKCDRRKSWRRCVLSRARNGRIWLIVAVQRDTSRARTQYSASPAPAMELPMPKNAMDSPNRRDQAGQDLHGLRRAAQSQRQHGCEDRGRMLGRCTASQIAAESSFIWRLIRASRMGGIERTVCLRGCSPRYQ